MKVTLIQTKLYWENSSKNFEHLNQVFSNLKPTDIIILPEMFSTGFTMNTKYAEEFRDNSESISWMKDWSRKLNCAIVGSISTKVDNDYFNRLLFVKPDNTFSTYDKKHTFTFSNEDKHYKSGNSKLIESYNGWNICPLICYDLRFPVWSRNRVVNGKPEYDLLIYVANWPSVRINHWSSLLKARAIENQCYVIGVNRVGSDNNGMIYSGDSTLISPKGEIIWSLKDSEGVYQSEIKMADLLDYRLRFPVLMDADKFSI